MATKKLIVQSQPVQRSQPHAFLPRSSFFVGEKIVGKKRQLKFMMT